MPQSKKAQNASSRKDTFYKRAKEQGYRARSSYKLIHLNNLHGLLQKAKVCIDLCAAPGSWMQVAREYMPSGSVIVGVDLFPIKPIPGTLSIKGDITTESLRSELRSTLKTFKADIVLHDGAPNVGCNWAQDSYDQNVLVLHSFKLACEFLRFGGDFVTKVFRCKDSTNLEFIFKALFETVEITKPQASRNVSAEIFYVCRSFKLKPGDKADPKFFDPKEVFKEVSITLPSKINLQKPEKTPRKAQGYEDGAEILFRSAKVSDFVKAEKFEEILQQSNSLLFDDDRWTNHPSTSPEIRACCKDIKVLGRREIRLLLTWRKALKAMLDAETEEVAKDTEESEPVAEKTEEELEIAEMEEVEKQISELQAQTAKDDKKKQRAIRKQRRQLQQKLKMIALTCPPSIDSEEFVRLQEMEKINDHELLMLQYDGVDYEEVPAATPKMVRYKKGDYQLDESGKHYRHKDDSSDSEHDDGVCEKDEEIFTKSKQNTVKVVDGVEIVPKEDMAVKHRKAVRFADGVSDSESDSDVDGGDEDSRSDPSKRKMPDDGGDSDTDDGESDSGMEDGGEERLTTDLMGDNMAERRERNADRWFSQDIFEGIGSEDDEDLELDAAVTRYQRIGGEVAGETKPVVETTVQKQTQQKKGNKNTRNRAPVAEEQSGADKAPAAIKKTTRQWLAVLETILLRSKDCVPMLLRTPPPNCSVGPASAVPDVNTVDMSAWGHDTNDLMYHERVPRLTPAGLALASELVKTMKSRRDFANQGWNRYMKGEEEEACLPTWFVADETENMQPIFNVPEEEVRYYTARDKAVNVRTIKKVMEAKARKHRRFKKTMQNVMKKAEALQGSSLMSDKEKQDEVKNLYKKAMKTTEKKETTYVVMKKQNQGKKPRGVTGRTKMVDSRMKHDVRIKMKSMKKKKTVGRGKKK